MTLITRALRGFVDELTERFGVRYGEQLDMIEHQADNELERLLSRLSSEQIQNLLDTIRARRNLLTSGPAYQNEVVSISKQILTFGAAGIGLTAAFAKDLNNLGVATLERRPSRWDEDGRDLGRGDF